MFSKSVFDAVFDCFLVLIFELKALGFHRDLRGYKTLNPKLKPKQKT